MSERVIDFLTLGGRHTRSIALDRDLHDDSIVDGYLITPNAIGALKQVGENIAKGSAQRAWKIVGPYGSGKSALGVVLAQLMSGREKHAAAAKALLGVAPKVAHLFQESNRLPLAVVGARVSFGVALAAAIASLLEGWSKNKATSRLSSQLVLDRQTYANKPLNSATGQLLGDFAEAAHSMGYQGVVLLIDEVGKFIEHAALYPEHGDLIALQQVAEKASKAGDDKLIVVAMLHQHFASYAAGVGRALNDEWHKVAARFEEVPFDEPIERYAHFASHAMQIKPELVSLAGLVPEARRLYGKALDIDVLRAPSAIDKELFEHPETLYPLHPLTVACLAVISKRYGQSERSFHAFLKGNEPLGLKDFAERTFASPKHWYGLPELYDFLAEGFGLRFRDLTAERRWAFAKTSIGSAARDNLASRALKAIAIMELVQSGVNAPVTGELIAFALGEGDIGAVSTKLDQLASEGTLIKRRKKPEYNFAVSDAVNVEALFDEAAQANEDELIIEGISSAVSQRPVVANRHYDRTGTIRTLGVIVGSVSSLPQVPSSLAAESAPDAWLKLTVFPEGSDDERTAKKWLKEDCDVLSIAASVPLSAEGRAAVAEFAIWQRVLRQVNSKRLDPWTNRYVEGRLQEAREAVGRLVTSSLVPSVVQLGPAYWYKGEKIPDSAQMNPSQVASWLFDKVYSKAPAIINELINKDRPAPAIVLARQRIFDVILSGNHTRPICGESEFPPERLIHLTLLRKTGIWHEDGGRWQLRAPARAKGENHTDISEVWGAISEVLSADEKQSFEEVLSSLAAPPYGIRSGPASIWVGLYLLINRERCAVFENDTLVLEASSEHFQRMFKKPRSFSMRELVGIDRNRRLLTDYRAVLSAIGCELPGEPTVLEVARTLYRWYSRNISDFAKQTTRVSKDAALVRSTLTRATDPIKLLTEDFPRAHLERKSKESFPNWLKNALTEIGTAHRQLQKEIAADLSKGFGILGDLARIRGQLQAECTASASDIADVRLKSFIIRCSDVSLTDEKWLDSVGSLVVQSALDGWQDDTVNKFKQSLTELCGHYKRWMQVVILRKKAPRAADRFVGLTITQAGGQESSILISTSNEAKALAKNLLSAATTSTNGDKEMAAAALAQALLELNVVVDNQETEANRGRRKAS
jgi:hypothetical protein